MEQRPEPDRQRVSESEIARYVESRFLGEMTFFERVLLRRRNRMLAINGLKEVFVAYLIKRQLIAVGFAANLEQTFQIAKSPYGVSVDDLMSQLEEGEEKEVEQDVQSSEHDDEGESR
jgi:hypothetical protein